MKMINYEVKHIGDQWHDATTEAPSPKQELQIKVTDGPPHAYHIGLKWANCALLEPTMRASLVPFTSSRIITHFGVNQVLYYNNQITVHIPISHTNRTCGPSKQWKCGLNLNRVWTIAFWCIFGELVWINKGQDDNKGNCKTHYCSRFIHGLGMEIHKVASSISSFMNLHGQIWFLLGHKGRGTMRILSKEPSRSIFLYSVRHFAFKSL